MVLLRDSKHGHFEKLTDYSCSLNFSELESYSILAVTELFEEAYRLFARIGHSEWKRHWPAMTLRWRKSIWAESSEKNQNLKSFLRRRNKSDCSHQFWKSPNQISHVQKLSFVLRSGISPNDSLKLPWTVRLIQWLTTMSWSTLFPQGRRTAVFRIAARRMCLFPRSLVSSLREDQWQSLNGHSRDVHRKHSNDDGEFQSGRSLTEHPKKRSQISARQFSDQYLRAIVR